MQDVTDLREWPEVGQVYLVPTVHTEHCGLLADWPVFQDARSDKMVVPDYNLDEEFIRNFLRAPHFHPDPRFMTARQDEALARQWRKRLPTMAPGMAVMLESAHPDHLKGALSFGIGGMSEDVSPMMMKPLECTRQLVLWDVAPRGEEWDVTWSEKGLSQKVVVSKSGLPLCPHHGLNLHCVWDRKSQAVRCPMHGLEVDMSGALTA